MSLASLTFTEIAGIFAGILEFLAFFLYIISIVKGKTVPNRATWFVLTVVGFAIAVSYYASGARDTMWVPVVYAVGPFIIFLLSIKKGEGGWSLFDRFSLVGAFMSLILWWISGSALVALLFNISIDFFGMLPTVKKSYYNPKSEEGFPWLISSFSGVVNIFAIENLSFSIIIYPVYILFINGLVTGLLYLRRR